MKQLGLRIDIDTYSGARKGIPALLKLLAERGLRASFFFSVGPDNMGRHLLRLFKPRFLLKMLRSRAPGLYGWEIIFRGTMGTGPSIARPLAPHLKWAVADGHEIGLHCLDHYRWQIGGANFTAREIVGQLRQGRRIIESLSGKTPECFAAPSWRGTEALLNAERELGLCYGSDCRGKSIFRPLIVGQPSPVPQIPVTLPTYDEVIGHSGVSDKNYNRILLSRLRKDRLNVLTIHAEVEGMKKLDLFAEFLDALQEQGWTPVPLADLLPSDPAAISAGEMKRGTVPGREGWVAVQGKGEGCALVD